MSRLSRFELEEQIKELTGGDSPGDGETIVFNKDAGWIFDLPPAIAEGDEVLAGSDAAQQAQIDALISELNIEEAALETHKSSSDHDPRYYTKAEIDATLSAIGVGLLFPFYDYTGTLDHISLVTNSALPFFDYLGASHPIPIVSL